MSAKSKDTTKTAHVMSLLRKNAPPAAAEPQEAPKPETEEASSAPPPVKHPIIASLNEEAQVAQEIRGALEQELERIAPPPPTPPAPPAEPVPPVSEAFEEEPEEGEPEAPEVPVEELAAAPEPAAAESAEKEESEASEAPVEEPATTPEPAAAESAEKEEPEAPEASMEEPAITPEPAAAESAEKEEPEAPEAPMEESAIAPEPSPASDAGTLAELDLKSYNVMEILVDDEAERYMKMFGLCCCPRCRADVKALALNNLQPKYVVMWPGNYVPRITVYERQFHGTVTAQILRACSVVAENPRHESGS